MSAPRDAIAFGFPAAPSFSALDRGARTSTRSLIKFYPAITPYCPLIWAKWNNGSPFEIWATFDCNNNSNNNNHHVDDNTDDKTDDNNDNNKQGNQKLPSFHPSTMLLITLHVFYVFFVVVVFVVTFFLLSFLLLFLFLVVVYNLGNKYIRKH